MTQGQHYLISLKANQKTLHQTLKTLHQSGQFLSVASDFSDTHNREVERRVFVYEVPPHLCHQWAGLKRLIWVERCGWRLNKPFHESIGYISDLELDATEFMHRIQQYWGIENRLHWVRDVTFAEDYARPGGNAPSELGSFKLLVDHNYTSTRFSDDSWWGETTDQPSAKSHGYLD
ncbi:MAG: hypothetical protein Fur0025_47600 [Oscillatoriaceae cyanobacterium]